MVEDTGGPAFPSERPTAVGMTLRDYFAAKVLQGSQANPECSHWSSVQHVDYAYEVADAMLEARK